MFNSKEVERLGKIVYRLERELYDLKRERQRVLPPKTECSACKNGIICIDTHGEFVFVCKKKLQSDCADLEIDYEDQRKAKEDLCRVST